MAVSDYMRQGKDGSVLMLLTNIPEIGFIDAVKTKEICKAQLLTRQAKQGLPPGSPDVKITSVTNEVQYITRRELTNKFVLSNGSKIKVAFMNAGRDYIVYHICNEKYKVIKLPDNCKGSFNGNGVKPGYYLVCRVNEDGSINMDSAGTVSPAKFRKMFTIPPQDVIQKHIGSGSKRFTLFDKLNQIRGGAPINRPINRGMQQTASVRPTVQSTPSNSPQNTRIDTSQLGINPSSIKVPTAGESLRAQLNNNKQGLVVNSANRNNTNKPENEDNDSKYKYTVINRIVDINGKKVGYTVMELKTGAKRQVTEVQLAQACKNKLVNNVILATRESTNLSYLKGKGIVLANLPEVIA